MLGHAHKKCEREEATTSRKPNICIQTQALSKIRKHNNLREKVYLRMKLKYKPRPANPGKIKKRTPKCCQRSSNGITKSKTKQRRPTKARKEANL